MFKKDSLYSINKKNPDAVVYKFANGEQSLVTRADFATEEEFLANVKHIAHNAVLDACTGSNPRAIDDETMEKLLSCTFYGNRVDF